MGARIVLLGLGFVLLTAVSMAGQSDPPPGKVAFDRVCKTCHGEEARGDAGPRLVPLEMEYDELLAKVREGGGEMPPVSTRTLSDDDVKQIFNYLKSLSSADQKGATAH
jgi:mono/diheme cytochrome c family protein